MKRLFKTATRLVCSMLLREIILIVALVLIMDLIAHHQEILPPIISQKKRESDTRPLPQRKRTRPVDIRMSRSRLSVGADPRKLLEAQLEAKGMRSRNASPEKDRVPPVPTLPTALAEKTTKDAEGLEEVPTPKAVTFADGNAKPEDSDLPPRPVFAEPPAEDEKSSDVIISPPSPAISPTEEVAAGDASSPQSASGSEEPTGGSSSLKRSSSGEASRVRGPRTARGPRPPGPTHTASKTNANDYAPRKHGGHAAAGAFSRRTQESDAEDDVVGR